jgi:hypothetical protein
MLAHLLYGAFVAGARSSSMRDDGIGVVVGQPGDARAGAVVGDNSTAVAERKVQPLTSPMAMAVKPLIINRNMVYFLRVGH